METCVQRQHNQHLNNQETRSQAETEQQEEDYLDYIEAEDWFKEAMRGASLEEIKEFDPMILAVLCGGLSKRTVVLKSEGQIVKKFNKYTPTSFRDRDHSGIIAGAKLRCIAVKRIYRELVRHKSVSQNRESEKESVDDEFLSVAICGDSPVEYIKYISSGIYKVPDKKLIYRPNSYTTFSDVWDIIDYASSHYQGRICIISNGYHLPRIKIFYKSLLNEDDYNERAKHILLIPFRYIKEVVDNVRVKFVSAEDVLIEIGKGKKPQDKHKRFTKIIHNAVKSDGYKLRIASEQKGVLNFESGNYQYRHPDIMQIE